MLGFARTDGFSRWIGRIAAMITIALALLLNVTAVQAQADFGQRTPGQRIYDRAGLLTPDELATLESRAAAVERAGAPVVVYLQARDADYNATERDARRLMDAWDVQSRSGARDGLVVFANLKPGDLRHGNAALFAGEQLINGRLPQREIQRV